MRSMPRPAPHSLPRSFVIRLYRFDAIEVDGIAGTVEDVATGGMHSFRNASELLALLRAGRGAIHDSGEPDMRPRSTQL